ncbi:MAG: thioesterase family protein [Acidimicrobiia bacterium]
MSNRPTALFVTDGDTFTPTELSRGPWDPDACHGGPVGALLARVIEHTPNGGVDWQLARVTIELTRPVPLAPLRVLSDVVRPGRKVALVEARLVRAVDDVEVARVRALRIRSATVPLPEHPAIAAEPPFGEAGIGAVQRPSFDNELVAFHNTACDMRFASGSFLDPGPVQVWIRLNVPLLDGEQPSGVQRALAAADFGNGVSGTLPYERYLFINPELTVHLLREPVGEWIGMDSRSHYGPKGAGMAESALYDAHGRVGRGVQSLFVDER